MEVAACRHRRQRLPCFALAVHQVDQFVEPFDGPGDTLLHRLEIHGLLPPLDAAGVPVRHLNADEDAEKAQLVVTGRIEPPTRGFSEI
jgi:hypothetical protein